MKVWNYTVLMQHLTPSNYKSSDSVAATEGVLLYSDFPDYNAWAK